MRFLKSVEVILICFLIGVTIYMGRLLNNLKNEEAIKKEEIASLNEKINNLDKDINDTNIRINEVSDNSKDLVTEYNNWLRQKEKLEKTLGY